MTKLEKAAREHTDVWRSPIEEDDVFEAFLAGAAWQRERDAELAESCFDDAGLLFRPGVHVADVIRRQTEKDSIQNKSNSEQP